MNEMQTILPVAQNAITAFTARASGALSFASPEVAVRQPVSNIVEATIRAATSNSEQTQRAYQISIGRFVEWLDGQRGHYAPMEWRPFAERKTDGKRVLWSFNAPAAILRLVDQAALDAYRDSIAGEASPNTVNVRVFAVRTFLQVALRDGVLTQEQAANMGLRPYRTRLKHDEQPVGRRLSREEVRALRAAVDVATNKGKRDLAILDVMLYAALRRDEVCRLAPTNLVLDNGRRWIVLRGKGQKTRRVKVHDALHATLTAWMDATRITWGDSRPLFVSVAKGDKIGKQQIDSNAIARLVEEYAERAQIGDVNPHDLRRTAARNAYDNGAGLVQVQMMLGHADPKTTARYIGADFDDSNTATDHIRY